MCFYFIGYELKWSLFLVLFLDGDERLEAAGVMDCFKWWSWKETTVEITFSRCTLEVTSVMHGVNTYYSQSPMRGQAIANSEVKVNIYDHQPTAVHDTLARVLVLIHPHSHNVAFQHLNGCFVRSEVTPHQRLFSWIWARGAQSRVWNVGQI